MDMEQKKGERLKAAADAIKWQLARSRKAGRYYGFPECCLGAHHVNSDKPYIPASHPAVGTGYIPCQMCVSRDWDEVTAEIQKLRICSKPFPFGRGATHVDEYRDADERGLLELTTERLLQLERKRDFDALNPETPIPAEAFDPRGNSPKRDRGHEREA